PFMTAAEVEARTATAKAAADDDRRRAMIGAHIPAKDIGRLLSGDLVETATIARVRAWLADPDARRLLVLAGAKDSGKTTAAAFAVSVEPSPADRRWLTRGAAAGRYIEAELLLGAWWWVGARADAQGQARDADPVTGMNKHELL